MSKAHEKKAKLRPARDVISRLRWSPPEQSSLSEGNNQVVFGYIDRINGTMEKAVEDYQPMVDGGDIPEHRILYFRRVVNGDENVINIIWDRGGRVDHVFDSGDRDRVVSNETIEEARAAISNMARLEEEKAERREQKARLRERRARSRVLDRIGRSSVVPDHHNEDRTTEVSESRDRFHWKSIHWHHFGVTDQRWKRGDDEHTSSDQRKNRKKEEEGKESFTILTWNVLSNIHPGIDTDENGIGGHEFRWSVLAEAIRDLSPDIVALQEATPEFSDQMLEIDWVRADYASSISPHDKCSVEPIGNMLLWKKSRVKASALHACVDGIRWRVISATFRFGPDNNILVCANAHLPSDKPGSVGTEEKVSHHTARRRELSSIIGHLQTTETDLKRSESRTEINHVIVGDFNCSASELEDGSFAGGGGYFQDIWSDVKGVSGENSGYTFDPMGNPRAAKSSSNPSGRRIDRMYLNIGSVLKPVQADVIDGKSDCDDMFPSDHYGVCAQFRLRESKPIHLYKPLQYHNAWAANAPSSKDSMLAIVLDNEKLEQIKETYDPDSSLLAPHITLLYGFVELHHESLDLAIKAIRDCINSVFQERSPSLQGIRLSEESLDVFEHRSSTTLIARPNVGHKDNEWLMQLYSSLRSCFRWCNEQEVHSAEGFVPHVSLGKFGFTSSARKAAAEFVHPVSSLMIPVRSIDVLERSQNGKFQSIASVPFSIPPSTRSKGLRCIVQDTGLTASRFFSEKSKMVLSIINRASRSASRSFGGLYITSEVIPYGSVALDCALPKMSDLDVVIMLRTNHEIVSSSQFLALADDNCTYLKKLMACLKETHAASKMRLRSIHSDLNLLSIQIQPNLPSADIILCLLGRDGMPVNNESDTAFDSIRDNEDILNVLADIETNVECTCNSISVKDVFCASLRLIKLWSFNRGVYGAKFGFLGGGSWAIFLAYIMKNKVEKEAIFAGASSLSEAAHHLTLTFFSEASRWPWPQPIALKSEGIENQHVPSQQPRLAVLTSSSASNIAKNSTISTCVGTAAELRRASTLAKGIIQTSVSRISALQSIISPLKVQELIASSPEVIALELVTDRRESLPLQQLDDIEAWGCGQYLSFLVRLERRLDASLLRPFSRAFKVRLEWNVDSSANNSGTAKEGFAWIIGVSGILSKEERGVVKHASSRIASSFVEGMDRPGFNLSATVLSSTDAINRIVT